MHPLTAEMEIFAEEVDVKNCHENILSTLKTDGSFPNYF